MHTWLICSSFFWLLDIYSTDNVTSHFGHTRKLALLGWMTRIFKSRRITIIANYLPAHTFSARCILDNAALFDQNSQKLLHAWCYLHWHEEQHETYKPSCANASIFIFKNNNNHFVALDFFRVFQMIRVLYPLRKEGKKKNMWLLQPRIVKHCSSFGPIFLFSW